MSDERRIATEQDAFSLDHLIGWLAQQPSEKTYEFWCNDCCLGQYFKDVGIEFETIGTRALFMKGIMQERQLPRHFNQIAQRAPHTFGAALERARAIRD